MGFASLLAQMKKGKSTSPESSQQEHRPSLSQINKSKQISTNSSKQLPKSTSIIPQQPQYDPAVARLKAARKAEKEALQGQKTAMTHSKQTSHSTSTATHTIRQPSKAPSLSKQEQLKRQILQDKQQARPVKKLSYKELMQQASKVDGSKMAITIKSKTTSPEPPAIRLKSTEAKKPTPMTKNSPAQTQTQSPTQRSSSVPDRTKTSTMNTLKSTKPALPPPRARPPMRRKRPREEIEDDEDLSDFVVSEDENLDYHAEIANIFGRRRQYNYDDYSDDDDMEATGADILNEESKSSRIARLEEEREAELERRKKLEKLKKLKK